MKKTLLLIVLTIAGSIGAFRMVAQEHIAPIVHSEMTGPRIYAYRSWQSTGVRVEAGDELSIEAEGTWLYTPGEYHGPAGHERYTAPSYYPLPHVPGGALIGRIGETGRIFYVGQRIRRRADASGPLYLRIDDDVLTDNEGSVLVRIDVDRADATTDAP